MGKTTIGYPGPVPDLGEFTPKDGTPYRPSSGTEGEFFQCRFCEHCKADLNFNDGDGPGCELIANSMAFNIGEEGYPVEWVWKDGKPVCTAFDDVADPLTREERKRQQELPL